MLRRGMRSDTVGRAVLALLFYITLTSSHVSGKKRLIQKPSFPTASGRDLDRSPIYESNSHHHDSYPQFNDDHHQDYTGQSQSIHGHSHEDSSSGKYRYSVKKKSPQIFSLGPAGPSSSPYFKERRPQQLYTLEHLTSPRPSPFSNSKSFSGVSQSPGQYYSAPSTTPDYNSPLPDKKYAFAYAVRPKDGYSGDDYSHKESRDGKVTMGEYKVIIDDKAREKYYDCMQQLCGTIMFLVSTCAIKFTCKKCFNVLLPDGRLQVVRYTADGQTGFKADVTYEGEDAHNDHATSPRPHSKPTRSPYGEPTSAIHKQFAAPPTPTQSTYSSSPYKPNPIFYSNPLTSHPSLSPSLVYKESRQEDHQYHDYHADQRFDNSLNPSPPPSSAILYKVSPTPYSLKKLIPTTPAYTSIKKVPGPTDASFFKFKIPEANPTPKNIYDKIHVSSSRSPYSPVPYGHRAGPSPTPTYPNGPVYKQQQPSPSSPASYDTASTFSQSSQPQTQGRRRTRLLRLTPVEPTPIVAKVVSKSKLVPVELFKAGPTVSTNKDFRLSPSGSPSPLQFDFHSSSQEHHDTHYFIQDEPHSQYLDHPNQNQEHHIIDDHHQQQHHEFSPVKSSLSTFASSQDYNGNNVTPKPRFYVKAKPSIPLARRPAVGGLVYLETPGRGPRPNDIGVKEYFDRVPHDNLPRPKTTTHPYELGSKDYGNNVGYSPREENYNNKKSFTPSQEIPPEFLPKLDTQAFKHHHSREYLVDGKPDTLLAYDNGSTRFAGQTQDQIVYPNYE